MLLEIIFSLFFIYCVKGDTDYCELSCDGEKHTVCARKDVNCGPGPSCGKHFMSIFVTENQRNIIVHRINMLRNKIAMGETSRPAASNINKLLYDTELEYIAQCWVNSCEIQHDTCRKTESDEYVAQSLVQFKANHPDVMNITYMFLKAIDSWFNEIENVEKKKKGESLGDEDEIDDFYQMAFAKTKHIGCGLSAWKERSHFKYLLACNFGPNSILRKGVTIYNYGKPASQCSEADKEFIGLCIS